MKKELKKLNVTKLDRIHAIVGGMAIDIIEEPACQVCGLGGPIFPSPILSGGGH